MTPNITVITGVMNRRKRLLGGVKNWLNCPLVAEVVVVDWSSRDLDPEEVARIDREKVKVIRVEGQPLWCLSKAFNLAAAHASAPFICKMDVDYRMRPHFLAALDPATFWRGYFRPGKWRNRYLTGFCYLAANDFWSVGGYDERFHVYGYDDLDLYNRLKTQRVKEILVDGGPIWHVRHSHRMRFENQKDVWSASKGTGINKRISICQGAWNKERRRAEYREVQRTENLITVDLNDK